ncbi:ATP-citrate lyase A-1 [Hibiscus syriacus]|uniref:ATP-citrate lyase A-1 n=1 Tax=Hibiscus syriacus TaxID=106335 RepID=A0A6A2ZB54_HIBSY|nr:ATP-citrate lyase A-1 [Hibiscus syriacus]
MTADTEITATSNYWLNWRFFVCALFILFYLVVATILILKFEGGRKSNPRGRDNQKVAPEVVYKEEAWNTCLESIHPAWLLCFRMFAFITLLTLLVINVFIDGMSIFFFYTQWTFTLVTTYFMFGCVISIYGCQKHWAQARRGSVNGVSLDTEQGTNESGHSEDRKIAGGWIYAFQIMYQASAGASMLTDLVFWIILFPYLRSIPYGVDLVLIVCMHSVNAVFLLCDSFELLGEFCLCLVLMVTSHFDIFVIFQWLVHAYYNLWWPYPFLDLTPFYAPFWYLAVGMMHLPCYCAFALLVKFKESLLSRLFPESYRKVT